MTNHMPTTEYEIAKLKARIAELEEAALAVCHAWRDHCVATDRRVVRELTYPIAALGMALAKYHKN